MEKETQEIKDNIEALTIAFNKLSMAMIGDKLERKEGYLDQVDSNTNSIKINKDDIQEIKNSNKSPWAKIGIGASAGATVGGIGATKGGIIVAKIAEFFT